MNRSTAEKIVRAARDLIMTRGYNGFSYADIAEAVGIRKASIHHHFPAKSDLAKAVVEETRAVIRAQTEMLATADPDAGDQLRSYAGYWERCIADNSAPFCVAGMLAAELPSLPADLAAAVRAHFADLTGWLTGLLKLGVRQGSVTIAARFWRSGAVWRGGGDVAVAGGADPIDGNACCIERGTLTERYWC
jgi:TetR/AcrR family transcriptional repressor of nem operon